MLVLLLVVATALELLLLLLLLLLSIEERIDDEDRDDDGEACRWRVVDQLLSFSFECKYARRFRAITRAVRLLLDCPSARRRSSRRMKTRRQSIVLRL